MTLTEFLLARLAEDEEEARVEAAFAEEWPHNGGGFGRITPARVLAECEAKRRIVAWDAEQPVDRGVLNILASVYGDHHPDYDEAWRA